MKLTQTEIEFFRNNPENITQELLQELRKTKEGKEIQLQLLDMPRDDEMYYLDQYGQRISYNGNRALKKPFTQHNLSEIHEQELQKCLEDIHYFKDNYIKIVTPKDGVQFPDIRDYQNDFLDVVSGEYSDIVCLMPRQCCQGGTKLTVKIWEGFRVITFKELFEIQKEGNTNLVNYIDYQKEKFTESYNVQNIEILTPSGYESVEYLHKTVPFKKIKITLENNYELQCSELHSLILSNSKEIYQKDSLGKYIKTEEGNFKVISVQDLKTKEVMYDISLKSKEEVYYSNGILSHNSGKSVSTQIYLQYLYVFQKNINIGICQNKGQTQREFLDKTKQILINLPIWMQPGTYVWNKGNIKSDTNINILTDSPSQDAYRGYSINCLSQDSIVSVYDTMNSYYSDITLEELFEKAEVNNLRFLLKTQNSYQNFLGIRRSLNTGLKILTTNGEIHCTKEHLIKNGEKFIKAETLKVNDFIDSQKVLEITETPLQYFYDPIEVQGGNTYTSGNFEHHNCLVVDECLSKDETITIRNKINSYEEIIKLGNFWNSLETSEKSVNQKFTEEYEVLTKNGFKDFQGIKRTPKNKSIQIIFEDDSGIRVTENHEFHPKINVNSLSNGDILQNKIIKEIKHLEHPEEYFYDLLDVQDGHHYTQTGLEHENCQFIKTSVWEEFQDSIFPSQSGLAWTKNILLSTQNGQNHFYDIVQGQRKGTNGYEPFEVPWTKPPRYKKDGTLYTNEEFKKDIIAKNGEVHFNQNYQNEFVGSSMTLLKQETLENLKPKKPEYIRDNKLKVYQDPVEGERYIMTVDAQKDGTDYFTVNIIKITQFPFEQVQCQRLQVNYLLMPEYLYDWQCSYNYQYVIIENNEGQGQSVQDVLYTEYEYENLHFDMKLNTKTRKKKEHPGFRTTKGNRPILLITMKTFLEEEKLIIHDLDLIEEFKHFLLINGKYQADDGYHDDLVMGLSFLFVPFIDSQNFNDFGEVLGQLFDKDLDQDYNFMDNIVFGDFDQEYTEEREHFNGFSEFDGIDYSHNYGNFQESEEF